MQQEKPLEGEVVWITGGGSGIGAAAALELAGAGASVILTGRRSKPLTDVVERVANQGGRARACPGDLRRPGVAQTIASEIQSTEGRLDVLLNNAGTNIPNRSWARLTDAGVAEVVEGNLSSAFAAVIAALPLMRRQKSGLIINIASIAGKYVLEQPGPAYTAAKHGMVAMSHSLNVGERQNGIRSTVLCPGEVATPILDKRPNWTTAEERAGMLQPKDVAAAVLFIATLPPYALVSELTLEPVCPSADFLGLRATSSAEGLVRPVD